MALRLVLLLGLVGVAHAEPAPEEPVEFKAPAEVLRASGEAATAGEWPRVTELTRALLAGALAPAELAEAHRLAGLAAFFQSDRRAAERHFLAYLELDLDGSLDAALYPPDVIVFFTDVKAAHAAELRAKRPRQKRYWAVQFLPPFAQLQNGDRTKAYVIGGAMIALAATNITTYAVLRSWCSSDRTCDRDGDRTSAARSLRVVNLASGIGLVLTAAYGVYDGVRGYRHDTRETARPYVSSSGNDAVIGVSGAF